MNFCGVDSEQFLNGSNLSKIPEPRVVSRNFRCGSDCANNSHDATFTSTANLLSVIEDEDSSEDEDQDVAEDLSVKIRKQVHITATQHPLTAALNNIQQTLDDFQNGPSTNELPVQTALCPKKNSNSPLALGKATSRSSPFLLHKHLDWKHSAEAKARESDKKPLTPGLDNAGYTSSSLTVVVQRLVQGYDVRLIGGPASSLAFDGNVRLFLHSDHMRFCVESKAHAADNAKVADVGVGFELPVIAILRLEVGSNPKAFTMVLVQQDDKLLYYDFEAATTIDREVIAASIIILLDQANNQTCESELGGQSWTGGTEEQPIPCSPSLDNDTADEFRKLVPPTITQKYNTSEARKTETGLVIHLEDTTVAESNIIAKSVDDWSCREISSLNLLARKDRSEVHDVPCLDCKPSASSTQLGLNAVSSANLAATVWCPADSCVLALNDIADACTGIFALKHAESSCASIEQQVVVEEFIATALGTSTAVYAYLTDRDIWNVESSSSMHEASKSTRDEVYRNRASLLNAQAVRLRRLRNEMTFAVALKQSKERMRFVQTVQSFDDAYARTGGTIKLKAATEAANQFHSSALLQTVVAKMKIQYPIGNSKDDEGVAFYDSDPEDSRPRNSNKGPRQVAASYNQNYNQKAYGHQLSGYPGFDEIGAGRNVSRKLDEETIVDMVQVRTECFRSK